MNMWFRLILTLLRARFGSRLTTSDASHVRFRVWPTDLDPNIHMNNGRYATLMDLGRIDLMGRAGKLSALTEAKVYPVVTAQHILYRRALQPFERFTLSTRLIGADERFFFMEQRFLRGGPDGELAARGLVQALFVRRGGGRLPTSEVAELFGLDAVPAVPNAVRAMFPPPPGANDDATQARSAA